MILLLCATLLFSCADCHAAQNDVDDPDGEVSFLEDSFYDVEMSESDIDTAFDEILCYRLKDAGVFMLDAKSEYPFTSMEVLARKSDAGKAVLPYRIILNCDVGSDLPLRKHKPSTVEFVLKSNGLDDESSVSTHGITLLLADAYLSNDERIAVRCKEQAQELVSLPYLEEELRTVGVGPARLFRLSAASLPDCTFGHVFRRNVRCCKVKGVGLVQDIYWPQVYDDMKLRYRGVKSMLPTDAKYLCSFAKYCRYPKSGEKIQVIVRYAVFLRSERLLRNGALAEGTIEAEYDIAKRRLVLLDCAQPAGVAVSVERKVLPFHTVDDGRMIEVQLENCVYQK